MSYTLLISLLPFLVAPLIYNFAMHFAKAHLFLNSILKIILVVSVILVLIPESYHELGYLAFIYMFLGALLPLLLERMFSFSTNKVHFGLFVLAFVALLLHALLDGIAIFASEQPLFNLLEENSTFVLPISIVIHRIPVAIIIWEEISSFVNKRAAYLALILMCIATVVGYKFFEYVQFEHTILAIIKAFFAGSLLHIIWDKHEH